MVWGTFTVNHFVSLFISIIINIALFFILKNRSIKTKKLFYSYYPLVVWEQ